MILLTPGEARYAIWVGSSALLCCCRKHFLINIQAMQRMDVLPWLSDAFLKDLTVVWTQMKVWLEAARRAASSH